MREAILELKFDGRHSLGKGLGYLLHAALQIEDAFRGLDCIAHVPLHVSRRRLRGYDQAFLVAREVARLSGRRLFPKALRRVRDTPPQVGLRASERYRNLREAFSSDEGHSLAGRSIMLVDDVMTTGATADAAARALLDAGAREVSVAALARD